MHGMLEACLPFLPKMEYEQEEEYTEQQSQSLLVEKTEVTMEETGIEGQLETFSIMLTGDCSVEFPL